MSSLPRAPKRLPIKSSLENLRKRAKQLARARSLHLTEAQHRLAHDHGFDSWAKLVAHVEALRDRTEGWRRDASENLPKVSNAGDLAAVRAILAGGGVAQHDLDLALARAVLRFAERRKIAELLVEHGADPDGQYGSDYGPIVFVTGECLDPDGLQFLIDHGADVTFAPVDTKYGSHCPLSYVLSSYVRGRNADKHRAIDILLASGAHVPAEVAPPVLAIHRGDVDALAAHLAADPDLAARSLCDLPYGNLALAGATLLHCAVDLGELACVDLLLERGADINARSQPSGGGADRSGSQEPSSLAASAGSQDSSSLAASSGSPHAIDHIGGPTPIFHAINTVADGNFYTLEHLAHRAGPRVDLTARAAWRGQATPVTPLEYAEQAAQPNDRGDHRPRIADELALLRAWPRA
jgi:hypothetical protein